MPSLLINNEKIKDPEKLLMFSIVSVAENLNLHQMGKEDPVSF
jgi:hypothetical protein